MQRKKLTTNDDTIEFKIILIGGTDSGRTQLINRLCCNNFSEKKIKEDFKSTQYIAKDCVLNIKKIQSTELTTKHLAHALIMNTDVIALCYDPTLASPINDNIKKIKYYLPKTPIVLIRTKTDLIPEKEEAFRIKENARIANEIGAILHFDVSAKEDTNNQKVKLIFETIADSLIKKSTLEANNEDPVKLFYDNMRLENKGSPPGHWKPSGSTIKKIILIRSAIFEAQSSFKSETGLNADASLNEIQDYAANKQYSRTAKAIELNNTYPNWEESDDDALKLIKAGCEFARSRSGINGLFTKKPREANSFEELEQLAKDKPNSRTAKFMTALKR